jgi:hypothetical protein
MCLHGLALFPVPQPNPVPTILLHVLGTKLEINETP